MTDIQQMLHPARHVPCGGIHPAVAGGCRRVRAGTGRIDARAFHEPLTLSPVRLGGGVFHTQRARHIFPHKLQVGFFTGSFHSIGQQIVSDIRVLRLFPRRGQLSQQIGASERTISRVFIRDTGMNYQNWRQQWRLLKAMEMLCDGWQLSYVAQQLEFVSDSAFITFFRQHTGTTPARYSLKNIAEKSPR
ncbi:AraC family transcriptional regulator [Enterobacter hormaechei subsp. xiangfangensis]|nr:AraC family transcriptional regulator [Enterobacter hormaechei subsp. xiangfangensis]